MKTKDKLTIIHNIISPYRIFFFSLLNSKLKKKNISLHVHFMAKIHDDRPRSWIRSKINFSHNFSLDLGFGKFHFNPILILKLILFDKSKYLLSGTTWDSLNAFFIAFFTKFKIKILWIEGNNSNPGIMNGAIGFLKRLIIRQYNMVAVPGEKGKKYILLHQKTDKNLNPELIFLPNIVDERIFKPINKIRQKTINEIKNNLKILPTEKVALCVARLEKVKGLFEFINNLDQNILYNWKLLIVGTGSQKKELLRLINAKKLDDHIKIINDIEYKDMNNIYVASDLFVLPSLYDPNPLSIVEALHSGLPLFISCKCGNSYEAINNNSNGIIFDPLNSRDAKNKMKIIFNKNKVQLKVMGRLSKKIANKNWNSKKIVDNFINKITQFA
jgi:glycosyltransferase involved in cell wall biosynthesis